MPYHVNKSGSMLPACSGCMASSFVWRLRKLLGRRVRFAQRTLKGAFSESELSAQLTSPLWNSNTQLAAFSSDTLLGIGSPATCYKSVVLNHPDHKQQVKPCQLSILIFTILPTLFEVIKPNISAINEASKICIKEINLKINAASANLITVIAWLIGIWGRGELWVFQIRANCFEIFQKSLTFSKYVRWWSFLI